MLYLRTHLKIIDMLSKKAAIQKKIDKNRDMINTIVCSDADPTLKKILITQLSKSNEILIETLNK